MRNQATSSLKWPSERKRHIGSKMNIRLPLVLFTICSLRPFATAGLLPNFHLYPNASKSDRSVDWYKVLLLSQLYCLFFFFYSIVSWLRSSIWLNYQFNTNMCHWTMVRSIRVYAPMKAIATVIQSIHHQISSNSKRHLAAINIKHHRCNYRHSYDLQSLQLHDVLLSLLLLDQSMLK